MRLHNAFLRSFSVLFASWEHVIGTHQALVGLERGAECFPDPMIPDDEGLELLNFRGDCLTFEGEINKLAVNVAIVRQEN